MIVPSHPWADRLSEYVDGDLDTADRTGLEQHLGGCAECRGSVAELRRVRQWLAGEAVQPTDAPSSAAWTAIARRIASRRRARMIGTALTLAAAAFVAVLVSRPPEARGPSPVYAEATLELETLLRDNRARLRPETVRALENTLAALDSAIAESQRALAADPANDYVIRSIDRLRTARLAALRNVVVLIQL